MKKQRSDERFTYISKCLLDIKDTKYHCLVDNISTTGALIDLIDSDKNYIHVGETGTLKVLLLSPVNYLCTVVRINFNQIGLQFIAQC